jgi:hypothetical protein
LEPTDLRHRMAGSFNAGEAIPAIFYSNLSSWPDGEAVRFY